MIYARQFVLIIEFPVGRHLEMCRGCVVGLGLGLGVRLGLTLSPFSSAHDSDVVMEEEIRYPNNQAEQKRKETE